MDMSEMLKLMLKSQNKDVPDIDPSNPIASILPALLAQKNNKPSTSRHGENNKKADREINYTLNKLYNDD
ncbi:MAG: hypothetical protein ACI4MI_04690 [Christensenellales bacterium]